MWNYICKSLCRSHCLARVVPLSVGPVNYYIVEMMNVHVVLLHFIFLFFNVFLVYPNFVGYQILSCMVCLINWIPDTNQKVLHFFLNWVYLFLFTIVLSSIYIYKVFEYMLISLKKAVQCSLKVKTNH